MSDKIIEEEVNNMDDTGSVSQKRPGGEAVYDVVESVILSIAVIFNLFTFIFRICVVDGRSMEDTLYDLVPGSKQYVSIEEFEGAKVLKVSPEALTVLAERAFRDVEFVCLRGKCYRVAP